MFTTTPRIAVAFLLGAILAASGLMPALSPSRGLLPERALAADTTLTSCDEGSLDAALAAIQSSGGGTLTIDCSGIISFSDEKTINGDVTIVGNGSVVFDGGGTTQLFFVALWARLELVGLTLQNGNATLGGAIRIHPGGTLEVSDSTFSGNHATQEGGAINNGAGTLKVMDCTFSGNSARFGGGALFNNNGVTEVMNTTFDNNTVDFWGGAIRTIDGVVNVTASTFYDNSAILEGGAIYNTATLTVTASAFNTNSASSGGALYNNSVLTVTASTFDTNSATLEGGALYNRGILSVKVTASTFTDNGADNGGAIFNSNRLNVTTSTFDANRANNGGAIHNNGTLAVRASTFSANSAPLSGGAIYFNNSVADQATIQSTILANSASGGNCDGPMTSNGSNLSDDDTCNLTATGDIQNSTAINLGELADNGGPTQTTLPGAGSDALDNASCAATSTTDQRGAARPTSDCDIGAVEVAANVPLQFIAGSGPVGREGESLPVAAVGAAAHGVTLSYAFDCDNAGGYETTGGNGLPLGDASASLSVVDCTFLDDASAVGVRICDASDAQDCITTTISVSIANVSPTIERVEADPDPVEAGRPVTLTVIATDPAGIHDPLTYAFSCDGDRDFETPGVGNQGQCRFEPGAASVTVWALVEDDDGGQAIGFLTLRQVVTLCANRYTGQMSAPLASGSCPGASVALTLPGDEGATLCIHPYTGALIWPSRGTCGSGYRVHTVPDDGPLAYCRSVYTNALRYAATGTCSVYERPGLIPG